MNKRPFQQGLRLMIVAGSMTGFLFSWIVFAHSGKPASPSDNTANTAIAPAPFFDSPGAGNQGQQPFDLQPLSPQFGQPGLAMPRLRTRGS